MRHDVVRDVVPADVPADELWCKALKSFQMSFVLSFQVVCPGLPSPLHTSVMASIPLFTGLS